MNKKDCDWLDITFKRKICIYVAGGPRLANDIKIELLKIFIFFIFGQWQMAGRNSKFT